MRFPQPLARGILVKRYKRFLADVVLEDGTELTAHCPNPGAMLGLNMPGLPVWLSRSDSATRKLPWTLELVEVDGGLVGVNTMHPNRIVAEALAAGAIPALTGYDRVRAEVKYGEKSRVDFLLERDDGARCWLEIKNVHLMRTPGLAEFPDCVAARSARHLRELEAMVAAGDRAVVLFVVQRMDCETFTPCRELDPAFAEAMAQAMSSGVEFHAWACQVTDEAVTLAKPMPVSL